VCGWQVKLCDALPTRGPYLSALEIRSLYIKRYINSPFLLYFFYLHIVTEINESEIKKKSDQCKKSVKTTREVIQSDQ